MMAPISIAILCLKLACDSGLIYVAARARRIAAHVQQPTAIDTQEIRAFAAQPQGTIHDVQGVQL
jgi:hypothetical protein